MQRDIHELFTRSAGDLLDHGRGTRSAAWERSHGQWPPRRLSARIEHLRVGDSKASRTSIVEMRIPSTPGQTPAPPGAHVASMFCQHFSYNLPGSRDWRQEKHSAIDRHFATADSYAPNLSASVVGHSALGPLELDEKLGLAAGDIFHGALDSTHRGPRA